MYKTDDASTISQMWYVLQSHFTQATVDRSRAMYKEVQGYFADGVSLFPTNLSDFSADFFQLKIPDDGAL